MDIEQMHYRVDGTGARHLVLLHPIGLDLTFFDGLVEALGAEYCVLRVDARGHGGTPAQAGEPTLSDFASDVHALMERTGFGPAVVAGFSFGGMVAQTLAIEHPGDVSALIAGACAGTLSEEARAAIRARGTAAQQGGMQAVVESTLERWFTPEFRGRGGDAAARERLLTDDVASWAKTWNAIAQLNTLPRLGELKMPALCLAAEKDVSASPAAVETMAKAIPGARFQVRAGLPHMLFLEDAKGVAAAMDAFLRET